MYFVFLCFYFCLSPSFYASASVPATVNNSVLFLRYLRVIIYLIAPHLITYVNLKQNMCNYFWQSSLLSVSFLSSPFCA